MFYLPACIFVWAVPGRDIIATEVSVCAFVPSGVLVRTDRAPRAYHVLFVFFRGEPCEFVLTDRHSAVRFSHSPHYSLRRLFVGFHYFPPLFFPFESRSYISRLPFFSTMNLTKGSGRKKMCVTEVAFVIDRFTLS